MKKRQRSFKSIIAMLLIFSMVITCGPSTIIANADTSSSGEITRLTNEEKQGVILHAWNWSFKTVEANLDEIKNAGYTEIQVSPIQINKDLKNEYNTIAQWWIVYQPAGFTIGNKQLGSEADFKEMCTSAHEKGIKIIVDTIVNHMGNHAGKNGEKDNPNIPADEVDPLLSIKDHPEYWHVDKDGKLNVINSYEDRYDVTHNGVSLPDLNTSNKDLQGIIKKYLQHCLDCGADGFRFDTAKHVELPTDTEDVKSDFWTSVLTSLTLSDESKALSGGVSTPYVYGEVLQGGADNLLEYTKYFNTTASNYGSDIRSTVGVGKSSSSNISENLKNIEDYDVPVGVDDSRLVTWVESHDSYANDTEESTAMTPDQIKNGWGIVASRANSTPLYFNRPANSGRVKLPGMMGDAGNDNWKDPDVVAVNKFHTAMEGQNERLTQLSNDVIMIERGTVNDASKKGVVFVNLGADYILTNQTINLADTAAGESYNNCATTGGSFAVKDGKISGTLSKGITVLYKDGKVETGLVNPVVSASRENGKFFDSLKLTLEAKNVTSATYSINGVAEEQYMNGKDINIGDSTNIAETLTLKLTGVNKPNGVTDGKTTNETYTYEKADPTLDTTVYFMKPEGFGIPYVRFSSVEMNDGYPGIKMDKIGDNFYKCVLPKKCGDVNVTINDSFGGHSSKAQAIGFGKTQVCDKDDWKDYNESDYTSYIKNSSDITPDSYENGSTKVYFKNTKNWPSVNVYFYSGSKNVGWPGLPMTKVEGSKDLYTYTLPKGFETANVMFNSGNGGEQIPASGKPGFISKADSSFICNAIDADWKLYVGNSAKLYFEQPSEWGTPYIYAYKEDGQGIKTPVTEENGVSMTKDESNGLYSYTFAKVDETIKVIFKDNNGNILPSKDNGLAIKSGEIKIYDDGALRDVKDDDLNTYHSNESGAAIVYLKKPSEWANAYIHYWGKEETKWPGVLMNDEGNGLYSLILPEGNETGGLIFNSGDGKQTDNLQAVPSSARVYDTATKKWTNMSKVYFEKPDDWSAPNAYVYDGSTVKLPEWPGTAMTKELGNLYSFTIPEGYGDANVIFNDGKTQIPSSGPGLVLKSGEVKVYSNSSFKTPKASELKGIDKSKLSQALTKADSKKEEDYTQESWNNFKTAINTAKAMAESTQSEINNKASAINDAINLLKRKAALITKVYFQNVDKWNEVYVHFWNTTSDTKWPGVKATDEGNGLYSYVLPTIKDGKDDIGVIFNNNNGSQTDNLSAIEGKTMIYDANSKKLVEYNSGTDPQQPNPTTDEPSNPKEPDPIDHKKETSKIPTVRGSIYRTTTTVRGTAGANADIVLSVDEVTRTTTSAGAKIEIISKTEQKGIGSTKADKDGNWLVEIPAQNIGTDIKVTAIEEGKLKISITITVQKKSSSRSSSSSRSGSSSSYSNTVNVNGDTTTINSTDAITIGKEISKATTSNIKVDLLSHPIVNKGIFEALASNPRKTLTLVGDNVSWIFKGNDILANGAVDIDTTIKSTSQNTAMINNLVGGKEIVNLSFNYKGVLPGRTTVQASVDSKYNDKIMYMYSYNLANNRLKLVSSNVAVKDGIATFEITKGSDYILSETPITGAVKEGWNKNYNGNWIFVRDENNVIGWIKDGINWYITDKSGIMQIGWVKDIDGTWYYLDNSGAMKTGWIIDNGTWYYLNQSGAMLSNTSIYGYTLQANGALI